MPYQASHFFLAEPVQLPELDNWVTAYQHNQQRFTFTEAEVLQAHWDLKEEVLLREDRRFKAVTLPDGPLPGQWQLSIHTLANQLIYTRLLTEEWDGENLWQYLQQLDQQNSAPTFHIFAQADKRFSLSQNEEGCYRLSLNQEIVKANLSSEQKQVLAHLADQLLTAFPSQDRTPWLTYEILAQIKHLAHAPACESLTTVGLAQWLRYRDEWTKVGKDLWFPTHLLPPVVQNRRYAVLSVRENPQGHRASLLEVTHVHEQVINEAAEPEVPQIQELQDTISGNTWKILLRTRHLNEGFLPIPPHIRALYPSGQQSHSPCVLPGLWFADGSTMTIWLDMMHHRLYGPDVTDQLAFLDAGTIIKVRWSKAGLALDLAGQDPAIFEEETRLIDLTELAHLRSTLLESYRASIRVLLALADQGMIFAELYQCLCQRQQHAPNTSTIRAVLSSSPEFFFEKSTGTWKLLPHIPEEAGASALRKIAVTAQQIASKNRQQPEKAPALTTMIATNRQQLVDLRSFYQSRAWHPQQK